ncbi:MAG: hypothetical protein CMK92_05955 [Pseudomonas sp.]|nr:hypothetical protein [Pseudomonas sp.]|tara:strand:- start:714 stop:1145 length:432 start_codon:yes stop_codon:yes gene_type:complete
MSKYVTICIPLYNCEATISKTLDCLIIQTYKKIKIKTFDNQSTDRNGEIALSYSQIYENIEYHLNEINLGDEDNFTKCILSASGDYTAVFHSDDIYYTELIETHVNVFETESVVAVSCNAHEIDTTESIIDERLVPTELTKDI